jgi:glucose/arabinose dehydrogenase
LRLESANLTADVHPDDDDSPHGARAGVRQTDARGTTGMTRSRWGLAAAAAAALMLVGAAGAGCKTGLNCRGILGLPSDSSDPPPVVSETGAVFHNGLVEKVVATGLVEPTDFAFLPDGRIVVSEKRGLVRLVSGGRVARIPVLDLRDETSTSGTRGLVTVQVDPAFPERPYLYVLRTLKAMPEETSPTRSRLSRFSLEGAAGRRDSEVILLGGESEAASCLELPPGADCLPAEAQHFGGQIVFAEDGSMFVTTGDGGGAEGDFDPVSRRAQHLDSLGGKVLRITREGDGLPTNPHWDGNPGRNLSKVWASGLRNPFRLTLRPGSGEVYVTDLGERGFDEISVARAGANLGWPCYEGRSHYEAYSTTTMCRSLYRSGREAVDFPSVAFSQAEARSLTGGVFYGGGKYPRRYEGAYFFADFLYGWMKVLRFTADGRAVGVAENFGTGLSGPVAIHEGPDGYLYYLSFVTGELRRIVPQP